MKLSELKSIIREELKEAKITKYKSREYNAEATPKIIHHFMTTGESVQKIADKFEMPVSTVDKIISTYLKQRMPKLGK